MKLKKWKNPNLTSLNVGATETCTYDSPHYWHCNTHGPIVSPGPNLTCPKPNCGETLIDVGCKPHPS